MRPTLHLGQDEAGCGPAIHAGPSGRRKSHSDAAFDTSMLTPGPMVEVSEIFFT